MCMRLYMFPWDFDRHLDSQHRKCKVCQQYLINDEMLQDHMAPQGHSQASQDQRAGNQGFSNLGHTSPRLPGEV